MLGEKVWPISPEVIGGHCALPKGRRVEDEPPYCNDNKVSLIKCWCGSFCSPKASTVRPQGIFAGSLRLPHFGPSWLTMAMLTPYYRNSKGDGQENKEELPPYQTLSYVGRSFLPIHKNWLYSEFRCVGCNQTQLHELWWSAAHSQSVDAKCTLSGVESSGHAGQSTKGIPSTRCTV